MWWRALGVAVVLLCVGVVGGYAAAKRSEEEPVSSPVLDPVPAVSPAVPTPSAPTYAADPTAPPRDAAGWTTETVRLRPEPSGAGVKVDVPDGWRSTDTSANSWNFADPD